MFRVVLTFHDAVITQCPDLQLTTSYVHPVILNSNILFGGGCVCPAAAGCLGSRRH